MKKALKDLLDYEQPTKYIVSTENYSDDFKTPVLTAGKSFILGYTDEISGIFSGTKEPVIIFDDFTRDTKYVDFDFKVKSSAMKILHKKNAEDSLRFFHYAIQNIDYKPFNHKRLWISDFSNFEIDYKSPEEQQKIAAHLDSIQSAIDNKKQQLQQFDELVKSKFVEMFGDPITNSKNFSTKKVIDVVTLQRGYDLPIQDRDSTGSIPVYGSNGQLGTHSISKIDKGIVTGRSGTIGEVHLCNEPFWPLNTTLFSNNTHGNNLIYLKYLLDFFDLKRFKSGVGVPTLNRNEFHDEQIIDVDFELQNTFAKYVQKIDSAKSIIKTQLVDLQELLDSKMDEYFGEL